MRSASGVLLAVAGLLGAGCAATLSSSKVSPDRQVVLAKCSACHPVPKRGSLSPPRFDQVLTAHGRRLRLSDDERAALRRDLTTSVTRANEER